MTQQSLETLTPGTRLSDPSGRHPRVLFTVGELCTEGSGVTRIVCDLADALASHDCPIDVYTAVCGNQKLADSVLAAPNQLYSGRGHRLGRLAYSPELKRMLESAVAGADVVHTHGLWMLPTSYAARAGFRNRRPVLMTTHGYLEPWALAWSRWKKRLAGVLFQNRDLARATCVHVNSESELQSIRRYGLRNPVAVIPNGVSLEPFEQLPPRSVFESQYPEVRGKRICLFLSRLHAKKGLEHLIGAWQRVVRDYPDWHLVVAGPDDGYGATLGESVASLDVARSVTITGPLYGTSKLAAYGAADIFTLPSFSEGFSMAVLEAMASRLPVLMTPGCNFPEAEAAGAAIVVSPDIEGTERGLRELLAMQDTERGAMGVAGRRIVEAEYTWESISLRMLELYEWLAGDRPTPGFVQRL